VSNYVLENNRFFGVSQDSVYFGQIEYDVVDNLTITAIADDKTPKVTGVRFMYLGDNAGATAITQLDSGKPGQEITLICTATTNTPTIADGGNFALSANWTPDAGDAITLTTANGTAWYEVSRSAN
jgi:hypothetical protein